MGNVDSWVARTRRVDLVWLDRAAAGAFAVGAIVDAGSQPHRSLGPVAVVSLLVLMSSIAWRRADPAATTAVAVSALIVFTVSSRYHGDGSFEVAAIALNFYTLGRCTPAACSVLRSAALLAYWLAGAAVVTYVPPAGTVGSFLGGWAFAGVLPFAVGGCSSGGGRWRASFAPRPRSCAASRSCVRSVRRSRSATGWRASCTM